MSGMATRLGQGREKGWGNPSLILHGSVIVPTLSREMHANLRKSLSSSSSSGSVLMPPPPQQGHLPRVQRSVLLICGSDRKGSCNRGLLKVCVEVLTSLTHAKDKDGDDAMMNTATSALSVVVADPLSKLPFYSGDLESSDEPRPPVVQQLWNQFKLADAVLIVTPEYNGSYPSILKNALDWMSRGIYEQPHALKGVPIGVVSAAGGGGRQVQEALYQFIQRLEAVPIKFTSAICLRSSTEFDPKTGELLHPEQHAVALNAAMTMFLSFAHTSK